ncbi:MAG TPA: ABC transporter ATP-binding protein [Stellaceae bacterium]|nr:ABC transporter ATP-binding protein [Stellaceae bacterium]
MDELARYAKRPFGFLMRYVGRRPIAHLVILAAILGAVGCSVSTQYGLKFLVDVLSHGGEAGASPWQPFALLIALIAGDNLLWRLGGWFANRTFVGVTGDLRGDLFRYLTLHAPSYFVDRPAGTLASRITATANAIFTMESMFIWNVLPPCIAILGAMAYLVAVSAAMTGVMALVAGILVVVLFRLAAAGAPLHLHYADRAAAVDGELVDVIANLPLVRSFGGIGREHQRFDATVGREMGARKRSLDYLEKLRVLHAGITAVLTAGLLAWAILLWQKGEATTGDVVLVSTLGFGVLHATRDLAVALVDATQHVARLAEAIATLLAPHQLLDVPQAPSLVKKRGLVEIDNIRFAYPDGRRVFEGFTLRVEPGERVGLVGESGGGKSTLLALLQRFHDLHGGRIRIDGQDIALVAQESLPEAIAVVPQDIALLNRSAIENIRYGRPDASLEEVMKAAEAAKCADFIAELPEGFATILGDRGVKLSGGQRQRIAIARAILKDAPILLLDEATSALDSESEADIRDALDRLERNRTVIAIAHRLSTLRNFDRIVVLQAGRIIEQGSPDALMQRAGPYRALIEREMARLSDEAA